MKILQINDKLSIDGGAEQYLIDVSQTLEKRGYQVVLTSEKEDIFQLVKKENPDLIILHNVFANELYKTLPKLKPTLHYVHDHRVYSLGPSRMHFNSNDICEAPLSLGHSLYYAFTQQCCSRNIWKMLNLFRARRELLNLENSLNAVIANSQYVKKLLVSNGVKENLIKVIYPTVLKPEVFQKIPTEKPVILFAARLFVEKGAEYLVRAMVGIEEAEAWILGSGWDEERLRKLTKDLGLTERVKFFGWIEPKDLGSFYEAATIGVVPSIWPEPFGLSGISLLSFGKPVVGFDVGGIKEWLRDNEVGFLVPRCSVSGLTKAIDELLTNEKKRTQFGNNAQRLFEEKFSMTKHVEELEKVIHEVLNSKL